MRKINKVINIALIFMLIGVVARPECAYSDSQHSLLRPPLQFNKLSREYIDAQNIFKVGKEGFEIMRRMISEKLHQLAQENNNRPLLVLIFGRPGTLKSTIRQCIQLLRFGLKGDEVAVFEHDSNRSMVYYDYKISKKYNPNLKLIIVEGYNTVPGWADKNHPDLAVEFTAAYDVRLRNILKRGWSERWSTELANAPRIVYNKTDLIIDTSAFDIGPERDFFSSLDIPHQTLAEKLQHIAQPTDL